MEDIFNYWLISYMGVNFCWGSYWPLFVETKHKLDIVRLSETAMSPSINGYFWKVNIVCLPHLKKLIMAHVWVRKSCFPQGVRLFLNTNATKRLISLSIFFSILQYGAVYIKCCLHKHNGVVCWVLEPTCKLWTLALACFVLKGMATGIAGVSEIGMCPLSGRGNKTF